MNLAMDILKKASLAISLMAAAPQVAAKDVEDVSIDTSTALMLVCEEDEDDSECDLLEPESRKQWKKRERMEARQLKKCEAGKVHEHIDFIEIGHPLYGSDTTVMILVPKGDKVRTLSVIDKLGQPNPGAFIQEKFTAPYGVSILGEVETFTATELWVHSHLSDLPEYTMVVETGSGQHHFPFINRPDLDPSQLTAQTF